MPTIRAMRILVANDDGYLAAGLAALVGVCREFATVDVVAPEQNASGTSNALTLHRPLTLHTASNGFHYVNGTPSDCVHVALTGLLDERPDLVVSGINNGANMGDDTLYSGTVAAAMEAYLFGIPAVAFSLTARDWPHLDAAAQVVRQVLARLIQQRQEGADTAPYLLNVNIPAPGPPPCQRARDPTVQPARRHHLLDRCRGRCPRGRRGHRFPCRRPR